MTAAPRSTQFVVTFRPAPGVDATRALRRLLKFGWRQCGLRCLAIREQQMDGDPFGEPVNIIASPFLVRLERSIDQAKPCCGNTAFVHAGHRPHVAELRCAVCGKHRGWLSKNALSFILETARLFGAPDEPVIIRGTMHPHKERKCDA
jgi:hypothetical protein